MMVAESVHNVYLLEGGVNYWVEVFSAEDPNRVQPAYHLGEDELHHDFAAALGGRHNLADPDPHQFELEYTPKLKLGIKKRPTGGRLRLRLRGDRRDGERLPAIQNGGGRTRSAAFTVWPIWRCRAQPAWRSDRFPGAPTPGA